MRVFPVFTLLSCAVASFQPLEADSRPWLTSVEEAMEIAEERDQRILVDLYADWCGWCKRLEEDVFSTPTFQDFSKDYVLLRVDTEDGAEGTRLQEKYEAYSLPTTLVLDPRQVRIAEVKGYAPAAQYVAMVQREIQGYDELIRGFDRFRESEDLRVLGMLADEFHRRQDGERAATLYRQILASDQLAPEAVARYQYQLTDALRLARLYEQAVTALQDAQKGAVQVTDQPLIQRLELLAAQISLDSGDCDRARLALESFVGSYPTSDLVRVARRTLRSIESEGYQCT